LFLVTNCSYYGMPSNYIVTSYVVFKASTTVATFQCSRVVPAIV